MGRLNAKFPPVQRGKKGGFKAAPPQGWITLDCLPSFLPLAGNLRHHGAAQQRRFITFAMERKGRVEGASERASESLRKIETVARTFGLAISLFAIRYAKFTGSTASTRLRELAIRAASVGALFLLQLISPHFAKTVSVHSSLEVAFATR